MLSRRRFSRSASARERMPDGTPRVSSLRRDRPRRTTHQTKKFTLMTFNVEAYGGYLLDYPITSALKMAHEKGKMVDSSVKTLDLTNFEKAKLDTDKMDRFKTQFIGVDVACLQETVIKTPDYNRGELGEINDIVGTTNTDLNPNNDGEIRLFSNHLKQVAACRSHTFTWPRNQLFYGKSSQIANAIYVSNGFETSPPVDIKITKNSGVADKNSIPRCSAMTAVFIDGNVVKVATVHLIGGRFEDAAYFLGDDKKRTELIEEKKQQLLSVIELNPDIICGDFNTKLNPETATANAKQTHVIDELNKYAMDFYKETSPPENLEDIMKKWLMMDEYNALLNAFGYVSVYTEYPQEETSAYGGVVDFIYYKRDKLSMVGSATIVDSVLGDYVPTIKDVGIPREKLPLLKYVNGLSDHAPVKATFTFK